MSVNAAPESDGFCFIRFRIADPVLDRESGPDRFQEEQQPLQLLQLLHSTIDIGACRFRSLISSISKFSSARSNLFSISAVPALLFSVFMPFPLDRLFELFRHQAFSLRACAGGFVVLLINIDTAFCR